MAPSVIEVLRASLPEYQRVHPFLDRARRRAIWAITHCRTPAMGGHLHACEDCHTKEFLFHSCNHRSCPQCGGRATAQWVRRELQKRVSAPYYMVTFTLPAQLRACFFGVHAARVYDLFFQSVSIALRRALESRRSLRAAKTGFTAVLHTWNQKLEFHPHIHCIVPGAGITATGRVITTRDPKFLVHHKVVSRLFRACFLRRLRQLSQELGLRRPDPALCRLDWGVDVRACGDGGAALRYLGRYVCRTAISDARMVSADANNVTLRWKDRAHGGVIRLATISRLEFVNRYMRHVLPPGMHAVRRYGYLHPAATATRERIAIHTGTLICIGAFERPLKSKVPECPCCGAPMKIALRIAPSWRQGRAPPQIAAA